jgi:hypothetical protein
VPERDTLKKHFREVFRLRQKYAVTHLLRVETHAKEMSIALAAYVATEIRVAPPVFQSLEDNSHRQKDM